VDALSTREKKDSTGEKNVPREKNVLKRGREALGNLGRKRHARKGNVSSGPAYAPIYEGGEKNAVLNPSW